MLRIIRDTFNFHRNAMFQIFKAKVGTLSVKKPLILEINPPVYHMSVINMIR